MARKETDNNFRALAEEYRTSASIHGIGKLDTRSYRIRPYVWLGMVTLMFGTLVFFLYTQVARYLTYPTATTVNVRYSDQLPFPAVTFCNINQVKNTVQSCAEIGNPAAIDNLFYRLSELKEMESAEVFRTEPQMGGKRVTTGSDMKTCVSDHEYDLDEVLVFCSWRGRRFNCSDSFTPVHTLFGKCFTFKSKMDEQEESAMDYEGLRILFNIQQETSYYTLSMQSGVKVIIHEPDELPLPTKSGMFVGPGMAANIELIKEERIVLPPPYNQQENDRACVDVTDSAFNNTVRKPYAYSESACKQECILNALRRLCGCRHFFDEGPGPYCSIMQMTDCYIPRMRRLLGRTAVLKKCNCPRPCRVVSYTPSLSYAAFGSAFINSYLRNNGILPDETFLKKNFIDMRVFFSDHTYYEVRQVPELTISGILGSIGGNMGLFLGASLLSLTELVELVVLLIISCWNARSKTGNVLPSNSDQDTSGPRKQRGMRKRLGPLSCIIKKRESLHA